MNPLHDAIEKLLKSAEPLRQSDFTPRQRRELDAFALNTRLLDIVKQGRGTVYRVPNREGLSKALKQLQPIHESELPRDLPDRSRNVGLNRSSKKGKSVHESVYLLMKAWSDDVIWEDGDNALQVAWTTRRFGAAALQIGGANDWRCNRPLLLVENQALFDRCDWLPSDFDGCLIYYAGQLPDLLLRWLSQSPRSERIVLFPDYDGVGLSNFLRLTQSVHPDCRTEFYWLPEWRQKLVKYGNPALWIKTRSVFENACQMLQSMGLPDKRFEELARLSQRHGKALEQEAIWL